MPQKLLGAAALLLAALLLTAAPVSAQEEREYVPEQSAETDIEGKQGWDAHLAIGASASFSSNQSVIGQPDGSSWTLGFNLTSGLKYLSGSHESRNTLNISETFTRTPVVSEFVRTTDLVELESIYYYHIPSVPWLGPFARLKLQTSIFKGEDVQPANVSYAIARPDGQVDTVTADRLPLTDPFFPFTLKESAGFFARPVGRKWLNVELRAGLGARQVFADNQLALKDNKDTPEIEVTELQNFTQVGAEVVAQASGQVFSERIIYTAGAEFLTPFYNSTDESDKSFTELTNTELFIKASLRLVSWASLDYEFRAVKQPALLDKFQVQNLLLLTIGYTLLEEEE